VTTLTKKFPPLSDSFQRLLALDDDERYDLRLLGLLVSKDPGAVAYLLNLSNRASMLPRGRAEFTQIPEVLQFLGADLVVTALFSLWGTKLIPVAPHFRGLQLWLCNHSFSLTATVKRLRQNYRVEGPLSFAQHQIVVLVDTLGVCWALALAEPEVPIVQTLTTCAQHQRHALHQISALDEGFAFGPLLGEEWGLSAQAQTTLRTLATWRERSPSELNSDVQLILLAEVGMEARARGVADVSYRPLTFDATDWIANPVGDIADLAGMSFSL
jgi:HD-like signal output (HDOD) protein